jgi:intraflagellar transport protein 172
VDALRSQACWEDALAVAGEHGGPAAHEQLAYAWAESLGPAEAGPALAALQLLEAAVAGALAAGSYTCALELALAADAEELAAHVRQVHAGQLQGQERFEEAEQQWLLGGQPRAALRMWLGRGDCAAARKVCEQFYSPGLGTVLLAEATAAAEEGDSASAEALYLKAQRPDLAAQVRAGRSSRQEAAAQPPQVPMQGVHAALDLQTQQSLLAHGHAQEGAPDQAPDELAAAQRAHAEGRWDEAIDLYLAVDQLQAGGQEALIELWGAAVGLAQARRPGRAGQVAGQVGQRLCRLGQYELASELLLSAADRAVRHITLAEPP